MRTKGEEQYIKKVRSFLGKMEWSEEEDDGGGISWLELYTLYAIHGGADDDKEAREKKPLAKIPTLQAQLASFRKAVRKLKQIAICDEQQWIADTSYIQKNRMWGAAVENRQAAIRGLPKLQEEDAVRVMKAILATRG